MLRLYNTLTRSTEPFKLREDMKVKMYTCGPSTYQRAHIGNYRTFLFEDVLQRYLEYLGYNVTRLIALTDVEDKALAQAKRLAASIISSFEENMDNDLDVKAAFEALYTTVAALHKLMKQGKLSGKEAKAAVNSLRRVDSVLQVIF